MFIILRTKLLSTLSLYVFTREFLIISKLLYGIVFPAHVISKVCGNGL